jgi:2-haloacid dehalogenase
MAVRACVFDAYGTLFDVNAAARIAAAEPGREALAAVWPKLAADWRGKQLQYTWLRGVMGEHADFWQVTQDGLDWAMEAAGLSDDGLRDAAARALPGASGLSGGARDAGGAEGRGAAGGDPVERVARDARGGGRLGRDRGVGRRGPVGRGGGRLQARRAGLRPRGRASRRRRGEVLFVSSNGWDAAAAAHYGFRTVWVNRAGEPVDRLPARPGTCDGGPDRDPGAGGGALMRFTAPDGTGLHFTDEGPRDGKVVLCLSGPHAERDGFRLRRAAPSDVRLIRMDYRGRGRSDWADPRPIRWRWRRRTRWRCSIISGSPGSGARHLARRADRDAACRHGEGAADGRLPQRHRPVIEPEGLGAIRDFIGQPPGRRRRWRRPPWRGRASWRASTACRWTRWREEAAKHYVEGPRGWRSTTTRAARCVPRRLRGPGPGPLAAVRCAGGPAARADPGRELGPPVGGDGGRDAAAPARHALRRGARPRPCALPRRARGGGRHPRLGGETAMNIAMIEAAAERLRGPRAASRRCCRRPSSTRSRGGGCW